MAILVKGEITITKGFKTWKEMVYAQDAKLKEHGIKFVFAIEKRLSYKTSYSNTISKYRVTSSFYKWTKFFTHKLINIT